MPYENKMETWYSSLPGIVQDVLHPVFEQVDEKLKWVAGDPDALSQAGGVYVRLASEMQTIAQGVAQDIAPAGEEWEGEAADAFDAKMAELVNALDTMSANIGATDELLQHCAQAAVDCANMIIDIVVALVNFAITTLVAGLALSVLSFGLRAAASAATEQARGAMALSRIGGICQKLAQILVKVAEILTKIARILQRIAAVLKKIKALMDALNPGLNPKSFLSMSNNIQRLIRGKIGALVAGGFNLVLPGEPLPSKGNYKDSRGDAADDYDNLMDEVNAAESV